jgi:hypothetical protein
MEVPVNFRLGGLLSFEDSRANILITTKKESRLLGFSLLRELSLADGPTNVDRCTGFLS